MMRKVATALVLVLSGPALAEPLVIAALGDSLTQGYGLIEQEGFVPQLRAWLAERGYDARMGARPMARVIQEQIKRPLAEELLFGKLAHGGRVGVGVDDDQLQFDIEARERSQSPELV